MIWVSDGSFTAHNILCFEAYPVTGVVAPDKSAHRLYHHFHGESQFYGHNKEQRVPTNCVIPLRRSKQRSLATCTSYHLQLCEEKTAAQLARDVGVHEKA